MVNASILAFDIIKEVAEMYDMTEADITGRKQSQEYIRARHLAMYRVRTELKMSYPKIGRVFMRDHSTVQSAVKKLSKKLGGENGGV